MAQNIKIDINQYIGKQIRCSCGRVHETTVKCIDIARGAAGRLAGHIRELGYTKVFLAADENTWKAAGCAAWQALEEAGLAEEKWIFHRDGDLVPDELAIGELEVALPMDADLILAVGSGTINDLCKFISTRNHRDYMIYATAPSMDGFTSTGAALTLNHVKTTVDVLGPVAVIGDTEILANAPMEMISAGLGDTLGKYTALVDWKLAHLINGEYYCEEIVRMVEAALASVRELSGKLAQRDPDAAEALTKTLVLTGLAMTFADCSRPASGCEHHLSHFWEMRYQMEGRPPVLHGIKVGIGLVTILKLYHQLAEEKIDFAALKADAEKLVSGKEGAAGSLHNKAFWEEEIRREYRDAADGILKLEEKAGKNNEEERLRRLQVMEENWPEICRIIREGLPETEEAERLLLSADAPVNPEQIGVSPDLTETAVRLAKEVRNRFTMLQVLWDLDLLDAYAKTAVTYFTKEQPVYRAYQKKQVKEKIDRVRCFVLDMDGTIYLGNELFPFTKAFLQRAQETGRRCVFFTNNSSKNKQDYLDKLARMGIPAKAENMYTSSEVIAEFLQTEHPDAACYVVGTPSLEAVLRESGVKLVNDAGPAADSNTTNSERMNPMGGGVNPVNDAGAAADSNTTDNERKSLMGGGATPVDRAETPDIVIIGFDTTLAYEKLDKASRFLEQGAIFYGVHEDKVCPVEGGHFMPDCGSICALMRTATGKEPRFFGKPARETLDYVIRHTGFKEEEIAFVGDRMYTDIAVADGSEATSILVLSGETKREELADYPYAPDVIAESLETLTELL